MDTCEICWDDLKPEDMYVTNCKPVGHKFHIGCIKFNYQKFKNKDCPMCRKPLNINVNNLYPICKHVLQSGKNKGKNCSRKGKVEGYCEQHKLMHDKQMNKSEAKVCIKIDPKNKDQPRCMAITLKGSQCKNRSKSNIEFNGKIVHICGIHKNYDPALIITNNENLELGNNVVEEESELTTTSTLVVVS